MSKLATENGVTYQPVRAPRGSVSKDIDAFVLAMLLAHVRAARADTPDFDGVVAPLLAQHVPSVWPLVNAFRSRGHFAANLDPLALLAAIDAARRVFGVSGQRWRDLDRHGRRRVVSMERRQNHTLQGGPECLGELCVLDVSPA